MCNLIVLVWAKWWWLDDSRLTSSLGQDEISNTANDKRYLYHIRGNEPILLNFRYDDVHWRSIRKQNNILYLLYLCLEPWASRSAVDAPSGWNFFWQCYTETNEQPCKASSFCRRVKRVAIKPLPFSQDSIWWVYHYLCPLVFQLYNVMNPQGETQ